MTSPRRTMTVSQARFARAQSHLAGGVGSGTRSPRAGWRPCPISVAEASGSQIIDADGNRYVDYQMGQGPLILGHRPPALIEALASALSSHGSQLALCHDLESEAADAINARMPSLELMRLGSSGTECVQYALRFARATTGRRLIVRFEGHYHGWSDAIHWSAHPSLDEAGPADAPIAVAGTSGMPREIADGLLVLPWNDLPALERAFLEHGDEIAAVITEPIMGNGGGLMPHAGYHDGLRAITRRHGALLIFDEVLCGMRVSAGGAQEMFAIEPDLTVLAKAVGAGFPVAVVGGSAAAMAVVTEGRTMHGGTYNSNPLACAAVVAALRETGRPGFYDELISRGERLANGLVGVVREAGLEACWSGVGSLFQLWFAPEPPDDYRSLIPIVERSPFATLHSELLERGILIQPQQESLFLLSKAHTEADIELTVERAAEAMPAVVEAVRAGRVGPKGGVR